MWRLRSLIGRWSGGILARYQRGMQGLQHSTLTKWSRGHILERLHRVRRVTRRGTRHVLSSPLILHLLSILLGLLLETVGRGISRYGVFVVRSSHTVPYRD